MSDRAFFGQVAAVLAILIITVAGLWWTLTDRVGLPDDTTIGVESSPIHVLEQGAKEYIITGANLDGHLYLFIRLENTNKFTVKHGASCPGQHGSGFFDG